MRPGGKTVIWLGLAWLSSLPGAAQSDSTVVPTRSNALAGESSPYLLLHAHNPVDWYPWGPEALARARAEDKPIFLSVGYSTCYWCHVMEREVFSNEQIAGLMNEWFINIKVDREERPDLDAIYMTATQLLTGGGGWPNSVFMTPELQPFYAGTYFPPEDRYGRPGFRHVLTSLHEAWRERRADVQRQAEQLTASVQQAQEGQNAAGTAAALTPALVEAAIDRLRQRFDEAAGGFGDAPKFPPDMDLELLLARYEDTGEAELLRIVRHSLEQMARGGIHDHLGGGFHRYSTDAHWRVPHFEKMLYNQAALARIYLQAWRLTGAEELRRAARGIFAFTDRVLRSPEGGFYAALDSETDGVEGLYYLWTHDQIEAALGQDTELFLQVYDLEPMEDTGAGVLFMPRSLEAAAGQLELTPDLLEQRLVPMRQQLLSARQVRLRPLLDTKVLAAWNGLMIDAYATGYEVLGDDGLLQTARQAAAFVWQRLRDEDGRLQRSYRNGTVGHAAFQQDYAFMARGLLGLHRATGEPVYLRHAEQLVTAMDRLFLDEQRGGYYLTDRSEQLIAASRQSYDGALPSGNSEAAHVLLQLSQATSRDIYLTRARQSLAAFAGAMRKNPGGFPRMLLAVHGYLKLSDAPALDSSTHVRAQALIQTDSVSAGDQLAVSVQLHIDDGWHVNANPVSYDGLIPTQLTARAPLTTVHVDYPPAQVFRPAFADDSLAVYTGTAVIDAQLQLPAQTRMQGGLTGLSVQLILQACDDAKCLAPTTINVPLQRYSGLGKSKRAPALHRER